MGILKETLARKIEEHRPRTTRLLKEFGKVKLDEVTIAQALGGMRGIKSLVTDISYLDPFEGIRFRGHTIPETMEKLPKPPGAEMPYVEGHFYHLLTGELPTEEDVGLVNEQFTRRKHVPQYVFDTITGMGKDSHPMTMFSAGILSMQKESEFVKAYNAGTANRYNSWEFYYEDVMNCMAKLPEIGAFIYRYKYKDKMIPSSDDLDLGGDFAQMMGIDKPYDEVMRMYFIIHSDHESGNVSAHATHLVASALSDAYYALSAGINGLAGPLHGLANQEVLRWIQDVLEKMGGQIPSKEDLVKFCWDTLNSGQVIPGYGHAVLRKTDPRFTAQREFALKYLPEDPIFKLVSALYEVVPDVLMEHGRAKNPWPNVDAHSGCIQWYYGVREYDFYTVLFGIGRALGVLANIVWDRALGYPLERPKSVTTAMLETAAGITDQ